jgi:hypothetical protein
VATTKTKALLARDTRATTAKDPQKQKRPAEAGRFKLNYAAKPLKEQS